MSECIEPRDTETSEALSLAYDASLKSYDWLLRRVDAWDSNIDRIVAVGAPITLAIIAKAASIGFARTGVMIGVEVLLILGALAFEGLALHSALMGKNAGKINLIDPTKLFDNWVTLSERDYKHWCVYYAAEDFKLNSGIVDIKADRATECARWLLTSGSLAAIAWVLASTI